MSTDDRQKYNFLVALTRQLREARRAESECANEFDTVIQECIGDHGAAEDTELADRVGKCEQWLAALEAALESLETIVCEGDGEDDDGADEGDDDDPLGSMEPPLGGMDRGLRDGAVGMGSPGRQQGVDRRTVTMVTKRLVGGRRGTE